MSKIRLGFAKPMSPQDSQRRLFSGILLVRILVGWVFLSEGIQKLLFPAALGAGRFLKIGIPAPQFTGLFVGVVEIVCGTLLIVGLFTILATMPLFIDIVVAIATTKVPMLLKQGFWAAMHGFLYVGWTHCNRAARCRGLVS